MKAIGILFMFLALGAGAATAAESTPLDGRWYAKFIDPDGTYQEARLDLKEGGGTWQVYVKRFFYMPCERREVRVTVVRATDAELEFAITNSTLRGCDDWHVATTRSNGQTYEGQLYIEGRPVTGKWLALSRSYW